MHLQQRYLINVLRPSIDLTAHYCQSKSKSMHRDSKTRCELLELKRVNKPIVFAFLFIVFQDLHLQHLAIQCLLRQCV